MFIYKVLVFIAIIMQTLASNLQNIDYCELSCNNGWGITTKHVVCERSRNNCGPHSRCAHFAAINITNSIRQFIIDKHNALRNKVALGEELRGRDGPQPKAANMNSLSYSNELEYIAQCWANTCQMERHSQCMRTKSMPRVGQNMALRSYTWAAGVNNVQNNLDKMIQSWYDEVQIFPANIVPHLVFIPGYGHYTEMIWANIEYVGCGISTYYRDNWYTMLLVCNYGGRETGGNILNFPIYKIGEPLSECPNGKKANSKYKGLCGVDTLDYNSSDLSDTVYQTVQGHNNSNNNNNNHRKIYDEYNRTVFTFWFLKK